MPIKISTRSTRASTCASGYVVAGVYGKKDFTPSASELNDKTSSAIDSLIANNDLKSKVGSCVTLHLVDGIKAKRVIVVQLGPRKEFNQAQFNKAMSGAASQLTSGDPAAATVFISDIEVPERSLCWVARRVVEIFSLHLYTFDQLKNDAGKAKKQWQVQIAVDSRSDLAEARDGANMGQAIAEGVSLSRDLGNLPGNICTPTYLANAARELDSHNQLSVEVLEEDEMAKLGMNSLLSVSRGSREPAKLIIMNYAGDP